VNVTEPVVLEFGWVGSGSPRIQQSEEPGFGAILVGLSFAMLVAIAGILVTTFREQRHRLNVRLPDLGMPWYAVLASVVRRPRGLLFFTLLIAVTLLFIPLGFWLRHRYG
jgi:hypothetical protein